MVQVEGANSKHRKCDLLPLSTDVAETMRDYLAGRSSDEIVWPGPWWHRAAEMLRLDMADANIESRDAKGHIVDFHGQRMTFVTALARAGVSPALAQKLARHSDINLTLGTYTRLPMADLAGAVDKLSDLRPTLGQSASDSTSPPHENPIVGDPVLARVVNAWENLPGQSRQAIITLIEQSLGTQPDSQ